MPNWSALLKKTEISQASFEVTSSSRTQNETALSAGVLFVTGQSKQRSASHLGLQVRSETPRFVLLGESDASSAAIAFHVGEPLSEPQRIQFHFTVEDVDAVHDRLTKAGVMFGAKPSNKPWGLRTASCRDPGGHGVELVMPIR